MSRIEQTFANLKITNRKALIPFITVGHPHPLLTVAIMHALVKNGASMIELGMPFSDPMADGAVIQQSSEQAIKLGMTLTLVLDIVTEFRETDQTTPLVLMGYLNPIEKMGYKKFVEYAAHAGVDGVLIVDSPPEESELLKSLMEKHRMSQIFLIAPTSDKKRQMYILSQATGFIYCVALKGVTGAKSVGYEVLAEQISGIKSIADIPVAVGFGINDVTSAVKVAKFADAIVIGSALVKKLDSCHNQQQVETAIGEFIQPIATAINP